LRSPHPITKALSSTKYFVRPLPNTKLFNNPTLTKDKGSVLKNSSKFGGPFYYTTCGVPQATDGDIVAAQCHGCEGWFSLFSLVVSSLFSCSLVLSYLSFFSSLLVSVVLLCLPVCLPVCLSVSWSVSWRMAHVSHWPLRFHFKDTADGEDSDESIDLEVKDADGDKGDGEHLGISLVVSLCSLLSVCRYVCLSASACLSSLLSSPLFQFFFALINVCVCMPASVVP
jgi:hypothetical protein